eukprot:IDg20525t1
MNGRTTLVEMDSACYYWRSKAIEGLLPNVPIFQQNSKELILSKLLVVGCMDISDAQVYSCP